jgi:hypothetical protein
MTMTMSSAPHETVAARFPLVRAVGGLRAGSGMRQIATTLAGARDMAEQRQRDRTCDRG